jgi:hypothetical protein
MKIQWVPIFNVSWGRCTEVFSAFIFVVTIVFGEAISIILFSVLLVSASTTFEILNNIFLLDSSAVDSWGKCFVRCTSCIFT